jgi:integrase
MTTSYLMLDALAVAKATEDARKRGNQVVLEPIGLHECRHTYASFLMAAGSDGAADRLNAYLDRAGKP